MRQRPKSCWDREKADILAGNPIERTSGATITVRQMANLFLTAKRTALQMGNITARTFNDYYNVSGSLVGFFEDKPVPELRPDDFGRYLAKLAKTRKIVSLGNSILRTRIIFNWAFQNDHIDKPVKFGTQFKQPNKTALRRQDGRQDVRGR